MHASRASLTESFSPSSLPQPIHEETLWQLNMRAIEAMESEPYPKHPGEPDCTYYIVTGLCRFGMTCRYNHPPNRNMAVAAARLKEGYPERIGQPECQGQAGSFSSPGSPQQSPGAAQFYGTSRQSETSSGGQGTFAYRSSSFSVGQYALQRENIFPERPDKPECQFYMKTGDCKFGEVCRFHHPRERLIPAPNCVLSLLGLPLRPGEPLCIFYSQYGVCKFGPNCKFDHPMATPMGIFACNLSTSSSADVPVVRRLLGYSSGPPALTLPSEGSAEAGTGKPR